MTHTDLLTLAPLLRWGLLPVIGSALVIVALVRTCRWISAVSPRLGLLVAGGLGLRAAAALGLFWVSYLHLPLLTSLQNGPGFWRMALDSQVYYQLALYGAEQGLSTIPPEAASRTYVVALAIWMMLTGTSAFGGVLLNLCCYAATCAVIVVVLRGLPPDTFNRTAGVVLMALSASPMLLFVSTQVLKDSFFLLFAVLLNAGVWLLAAPAAQIAASSWRRVVLGVGLVAAGMFVTSGVRGYYPAIVTGCCVLMLGALLVQRRLPWRTVVMAAVVSLALGGSALMLGSVTSSAYLHMLQAVRSPADLVHVVDRARLAFIRSGGTTNVAATPDDAAGAVGLLTDGATSAPGYLRAGAVGLATMFVPLTLLEAASIVHVSEGGAMQMLGDADTICFDIMLVALATLAWRLRRADVNVPYLVFAVSLAVTLTVLMAYVITNVGTLVRLRLMLAVPFWTLTFAFARLPAFVLRTPRSAAATPGDAPRAGV